MPDLPLFQQPASRMSIFGNAASVLAQWNPLKGAEPAATKPRTRPASNSISAKINGSARRKPHLSVAAPGPLLSATTVQKGLVGGGNVAAMQRSFNPLDGVRALKRHRWTLYDIQHPITALFVLFSFCIAPIPVYVDVAVVLAYALLLLMPATRQFFLPSMSIWAYLFYFFASRFIPVEYRPHIWVKVLPALENVLYGANLSNILSAHTHPVLDLIAWIPYGLGHFANPVVCSALLFFFAAPGTTPVFARCFGYLALVGVTVQLIFPCTPPWYELAHGLEPAHYGMPGSPAGLARIDNLLGVDMYTTSFTTAPVPFGAFPSLHAADATLEALFMGYAFPRFRILFAGYVAWIWWATMYLNHHYAVDLVAGSLLAAAFYYVSRQAFLPRRQLDKRTRWEYDYVELGERNRSVVDEYAYNYYDGFGLDLLPRHHVPGARGIPADSDEWTVGSTSSFASSPATSASPGTMSPTTPGVEFHGATAGHAPWDRAPVYTHTHAAPLAAEAVPVR